LVVAVDTLIIESPWNSNCLWSFGDVVVKHVPLELVVTCGIEYRVLHIVSDCVIILGAGWICWKHGIAHVFLGVWIGQEGISGKIEGTVRPRYQYVRSGGELVGRSRKLNWNHVDSITVDTTSFTSIQTVLRISNDLCVVINHTGIVKETVINSGPSCLIVRNSVDVFHCGHFEVHINTVSITSPIVLNNVSSWTSASWNKEIGSIRSAGIDSHNLELVDSFQPGELGVEIRDSHIFRKICWLVLHLIDERGISRICNSSHLSLE